MSLFGHSASFFHHSIPVKPWKSSRTRLSAALHNAAAAVAASAAACNAIVDPTSRKHMLTLATTLVASAYSLSLPSSAHAAQSTPSVPARPDSNAETSTSSDSNDPIRELIEAAVGRKKVTPVEYGRIRQRCGFKRLIDGRIALRSKSGDWVLVKPDLKVSGLLLLRDPDGQISIIVTDAYKQIDLSDDINVAQYFSAGDWEEQRNPVTYRDKDGVVKPLKLDDIQFRTVITLFEEAALQHLEQLEKQERQQMLSARGGRAGAQQLQQQAEIPQWKGVKALAGGGQQGR